MIAAKDPDSTCQRDEIMRQTLVMIAAIVLLGIAACTPAPTPEPTATPPPPTPTDAPTSAPVAAPVLNLTVPVIAPGTLVPNPSIGTPASQITSIPFDFTRLAYSRTGGLTGTPLLIIINADGTGERDGQPIAVSQDVLNDLRNQLDRMRFFDMRGQFTAPGAPADVFYYSLFVEGPAGSRQIDAQDGFIPPPLRALFTTLEAIGAPA
jgi:hypothetical protein